MTSFLSAVDISLVLVVSEFNERITLNLLKGAQNSFSHYGGKSSNLHIYKVPGAFEIPGTIQQVLKVKNVQAIIAIGAIIRGETPHFDYIAYESAHGIAEISRQSNIPIINGIITTDSVSQAEKRSEIGGNNKGWDAIESALKTIDIYQEIAISDKC